MVKITIDSSVQAMLMDLSVPLTFVDEKGQVLGFFSPAAEASRRLYEEAEIPELTKEELERLRALPRGRPLAAILADLENRA